MRNIYIVEPKKVVRVPKYVPNLATSLVVLLGIIAMLLFLCLTNRLTKIVDEQQMTRRHYLHRKYSQRGILLFFSGGIILHINYLIVEHTCLDKWMWADCEYFLTNLFELILHILCIIFAFFETIVCWIMKLRSFEPDQRVWHGLAVVQAANVAVWFDSMLKEAYHRINENSRTFDSYFSFCNATSQNQNETLCTDSSTSALWFIWSIPFLFPVTIEFALLVTETLLGRVVGGTAGNGNENRGNERVDDARQATARPADGPDETTRRLQRRQSSCAKSCCSIIFILICVVSSILYLVLTILVFVSDKIIGRLGMESQLQIYDNVFTIYIVFFDSILVVCCAIGFISKRKFLSPHSHTSSIEYFLHPSSHTSFLEYFLLLSTSGVLLQSFKRIVAFAMNPYSDTSVLGVYVACGVLDMIQSLLQIAFYYFAKDVKLQSCNNGGEVRCGYVFRTILSIVSVSNFVMWISDSFLIPEILPGITPSNYVTEVWPVFDSVVTPITIFFRFNSALLFWCLGRDVHEPERSETETDTLGPETETETLDPETETRRDACLSVRDETETSISRPRRRCSGDETETLVKISDRPVSVV